MATGAVTYGSGYAAARAYSRRMSKRVADISEFEFVRLSEWDQLPASRAQQAQHGTLTTQFSSGALRNPVSPRGAAAASRSSAVNAGAGVVGGPRGVQGGQVAAQGAAAGGGESGGKSWGGWWEDRKKLKWTKGLLNKTLQRDAVEPPPAPVGTSEIFLLFLLAHSP